MKKQCIIVGLGKYGKTIAKKLTDSKVEVLAVDSDMHIVEEVSHYVTKAVCLDVTSEDAWEKLPIKDFDIGENGIREVELDKKTAVSQDIKHWHTFFICAKKK